MEHYIQQLISQGEHKQQDFKFAITDSKKIAKSISAFANTDGGRLLIGVKDNGKIAGVRTDEEYYMIEAAAQLYTKPEPVFSAKEWIVEGKKVLEITIEKGDNRPYYALDENKKWLAYTRVDDENYLINNIILRTWKLEKKPSGSFMQFSDKEKWLLSYLENNDNISFSAFKRKSKVGHRAAENVLVKLISWKLLDVEYSHTGIFYSLSPAASFED